MIRRQHLGAPARVYEPSVVSNDAHIGSDTVIGVFCYIGADVHIGNGTRIQSHTSVFPGVTLGEDVFVGPGAQFTNVRHPRAAYSRSPDWDLTVVEDGATIGAQAVVVAPARVGKNAMVGAGAVVTGDVPAHAIVVGVPARRAGWSCTCGETLSRQIEPPATADCQHCKRAFTRAENGLAETK